MIYLRRAGWSIAVLVTRTAFAQAWVPQSSGTTVSLRGVSAVTKAVAWASGANGTYLRTLDGGTTWRTGVVGGAADLDFRAVHAQDRQTAWLLSSGPGGKSRIYKTRDSGVHWKLLLTNSDPDGFWDALAFWDSDRAIVLGDPVDGRFAILTTNDGGETWVHRKTPLALAGEGAFAASNSCLVVRGGNQAWFGTGGAGGARVFQSSDGGASWDVASTPLRHDSTGAGIFSLAFANALRGIAVGGDYTNPGDTRGNLALTSDGGRTWVAPSGAPPDGYRSAVAFLSGRDTWIAVGTSGSDISTDGRGWKNFDKVAYNAIAVADTDAVWAVGPAGRIARLQFK